MFVGKALGLPVVAVGLAHGVSPAEKGGARGHVEGDRARGQQAYDILQEAQSSKYGRRSDGDPAPAALGTTLQRLQSRKTDAAEGPGECEAQLAA